jgi:putative transcriptional regulator
MDCLQPAAFDDNGFDALLARLEGEADATPIPSPSPRPLPLAANSAPVLPEPLRSYFRCDVGDVPWKRLGRGAYQCIVPTGDEGATARLLRIPAGRPVPEHSHGGLELTLVLRGAFSDETGVYGRGDLQEADQDLLHQPKAAPGEDCVCLAITDAPLRFRNIAARLVQPWLNI